MIEDPLRERDRPLTAVRDQPQLEERGRHPALVFFAGLFWALSTALFAGIAVGILVSVVRPQAFGPPDGLVSTVGGVFAALAWIIYRLGNKRFLS